MKPDILLEAKLQHPRPVRDYVERTALTRKIEQCRERLIVFHANMGFGKTMFMSEYALQSGCRFLWYHLDRQDNDSSVFLGYLREGIRQNFGKDGQNVAEGIRDGQTVSAILNHLSSTEDGEDRSLLIMLDDFQEIENEEIFELLDTILKNTGNRIRMFLTTKGTLPRFVNRYVLEGTALVLKTEDLAFSREETFKLLESGRVASRTGNAIKSGASRAGSAIKSGASYLGNVVKNSASLAMDKFNKTRLGKWVQEKLADKSDEPGFFGKAWNKVKTGSRALAKKVKSGVAWLGKQKDRAGKWIGEQKEWADQKVGDLKMWKRLHMDEPLDNHEHERRVRFMERQGDSGYGKRYNDLVGELKELPGIERLKGLTEGKVLEEVILELEKGDDGLDEKAGAAAAKGESLVGKPSGLLDVKFIKNKAKDRFGGGVDRVSDGLAYGKAALGAVKSGAGIVTAQRLKKDLSRMEKETSDSTLRKGMRFAKKNADKKTVNNSFDIVKTGVTAAGRIFKQKTAAKVANKVIGFAESAVTSGMDKETRKESLKGLLGGVEGYRQLKERYKLKAPEMRRAIRQAIGVSTENDVVNMDRLTTSHDIMKNARDGDQASRNFAKRVKAGSSGDLYKAMGGDKSIFMTQHYGTQEA